jgi:iron(III) transport system permease protein
MTSGGNTLQTFRRVTFPLATPAVVSILLLTFVRSIEAFEIPAIVGIPGKVFVLTTEIYLKVKSGMFPNYGLASAYAVILIAVVAVGIYYYGRATREAQRFYTITGKGFRPRVLDLGGWRFLGAGFVLLLPTLVALPFLILTWASFQPFYARPSIEALSRLTFKNYGGAFANTNVQHSLTNSLVIGLLTATTTVLLTAIIAWLLVRTKIPGRSSLDYLVSLTLVFPGVVLGVAMLKTYLIIPIPVYGTIWILVIAYITRFSPYAMRYTLPGLIQIHQELEESAQVSGAGWLTVFRRIVIPLMMPALFGAWIWVFLISTRELSMAVLLAGPTSQVISSTIFDLWNDGQFTEMAAFSVCITLSISTLALIIRRLSMRWGVQL